MQDKEKNLADKLQSRKSINQRIELLNKTKSQELSKQKRSNPLPNVDTI